MNQLNSAEIPLTDQKPFRLNEINKMKDCFNSGIQERKRMSEK